MSGCLINSNDPLWSTLLEMLPKNCKDLISEFHKIATSQTFLDTHKDELALFTDDKGRVFPTFASAYEVMRTYYSEELQNSMPALGAFNDNMAAFIEAKLDKLLRGLKGMTEESAEQNQRNPARALNIAEEFNSNSPFKHEYLAVPEWSEDGSIKIVLTEASSKYHYNQGREKIRNFMFNSEMGRQIKLILKKYNIDFTTSNSNTIDSEVTMVANNLCELTQINLDNPNSEKLVTTIAEFIIKLFGEHPLILRLLKNFSSEQDAVNWLATDIRNHIVDNVNKTLENKLNNVNDVLLNKSKKKFPILEKISNFVNKIIDDFINAIGWIGDYKYKRNKNISKDITEKFFDGALQKEIEAPDAVITSKSDNVNRDLLLQVEGNLIFAAKQLKQVNDYWYNKLMDIVKVMQADRAVTEMGTPLDVVDSEEQYAKALAKGLLEMANSLENIGDILDKIDVDNPSEVNDNQLQYAKSLRGIHDFCKNINTAILLIKKSNLYNRVDEITISTSGKTNAKAIKFKDVIQELEKSVASLNGSLVQTVLEKERKFATEFLKTVYGTTYGKEATRIIFGKKINLKNKRKEWYVGRTERRMSVEDALLYLERDNSWAEQWLTTMSNNPDLIGQLTDKIIKLFNTIADSMTTTLLNKIRLFRDKCRAAGYREGDFMEEDEEGNITGNLLTPYNWDAYEKDFKEFKKALLNEFIDNNPDVLKASDIIKGTLFEEYSKERVKKWHKEHSVWSDKYQMLVPATKANSRKETIKTYDNAKYNKLEAEAERNSKKALLKQCLQDYEKMKMEIDSKHLPAGATKYYRLPQFRGTYCQRVRNHGFDWNTNVSSMWKAARSKFSELYTMDSDDYEYGSVDLYNTEDDALFQDDFEFEESKIRRLPLYGINKIKDINSLSRDIFFSTLAYGSMAYSYAALGNITDALEVTRNVLQQRTINSGVGTVVRKNTRILVDTVKDGFKKVSDTVLDGLSNIGFISREERKFIPTHESDVDNGRSIAYKRYTQYLNQHLYGVGMKPVVDNFGIAWNKIAMLCSRIASALWLGGNVHGALVNTGTGAIEIFKESLVGQYFSLKDWSMAHKYYYGSLGANLMQLGKQDKDDKISMFIQLFNARGNNDSNFKNYRDHNHMIEFLYNRSLYLPYALGDHYMQTIPFLALAHHQKVFVLGEDGKTITEKNLFDAYLPRYLKTGLKDSILNKTVDKGPKTLYIPDTTFKTLEDAKNYSGLMALKEKLLRAIENKTEFGMISKAESDLIIKYNLPKNFDSLLNLRNILSVLEERLVDIKWNEKDVGAFKTKAREITNRMHGVYNTEDKILLQTLWLGNIFMSMKGYAVGLATRRLARTNYNAALDEWSEGSLVTAVKALTIAANNLFGFGDIHKGRWIAREGKANNDERAGKPMGRFRTFWECLLGFVLPCNSTALKSIGFADDLVHNLRRNALDIYAIMLLLLGKGLTDDDDDEEEKFKGISHYLLTRWYYEQAAFNVVGTVYEFKSFTNGTDAIPGIAVLSDLAELTSLGLGTLEHERTHGTHKEAMELGLKGEEYVEFVWNYKKDSKYYYQRDDEGNYEAEDSKFIRKLIRILPYLKSVYVYDMPQAATDNWEYYRNLTLDPGRSGANQKKKKEEDFDKLSPEEKQKVFEKRLKKLQKKQKKLLEKQKNKLS